MKSHQKSNIMIWAFLAVILFFWVFNWIQKYGDSVYKKTSTNKEYFTGYEYLDTSTQNTTHNVDLPINNTMDCSNMCGPLARCYKTGEQCSSDIDCQGCNPNPPDEEYNIPYNKEIRGQNDAGKYSYLAPQYSELTTDIGTKAKLIADKNRPPPDYFKGVNTWRQTFDEGQRLFDRRFYSGSSPMAPYYPERQTLSGEFIDSGPLAANDFL
jgi:hypothetical protein